MSGITNLSDSTDVWNWKGTRLKFRKLYTIFPQLEHARSINFIVLPRGFIRGVHYDRGRILLNWAKSMQACAYSLVISNWPALLFSASPRHAHGSPCPMLTINLFSKGLSLHGPLPAWAPPCMGPVSHLLINSSNLFKVKSYYWVQNKASGE